MKLARFHPPDGDARFGVVADGRAISLDDRVPTFGALLAEPQAPRPGDPSWSTQQVRWLPPMEPTTKVLCFGLSYAAHASEVGRNPQSASPQTGHSFDVETYLPVFVRYPETFVGAGDAVERPRESDTLDWEGEVVVVIGRSGRRIPVDEALDHVAGYTIMAENSVRAWQAHSPQATAGKNWTRSGACGPYVVTRDEAGDGPFALRTLLNGQQVQADSTANLSKSIEEMISYISAFLELLPGDLIATGTPSGIGYRMDPPRYLRPGDHLTVEVDGLGALQHSVMDEPAYAGQISQPPGSADPGAPRLQQGA